MIQKQQTIPACWIITSLNDVAEINPTLNKSVFLDDLEVPFVPMPAVEAETGKINVSQKRKFCEVKKGYTPFQKGDVLFAKITPCMENGKMAVVPDLSNDIGFGSTEFHVLRACQDIEPRFLYYFVSSSSFRYDAEHNMTGAVGQKRVPTTYLQKCDIPLPPSNEQKRIVAKIEELFSELDKGIENLKTAREQLKVYRQAVLKHAFEGKLSYSSAGVLHNWKTTNVAGVTAESLIGIVRSAKQQNIEGIGASYIKMDRLDMDGNVSTEPRVFVEASGEEMRRYSLRKGDILFNTRNSLELVGKVAMVRSDPHEPTVYNNNLMRIRTVAEALPQFISLQMCGPEFRRHMERIKKATTSVAAVYGKDLWPLPLVLPDLDVQRAVISVVDAKLEASKVFEREIDAGLTRAEALRQSILKKAFSGHLVAQDPKDEPGSTLLKRVRAEKQSQSARQLPKQKRRAA